MDTTRIYFIVSVSVLYYTIGGFGNIISIIILKNKYFKNQPNITYLIGTCIMNIATIFYLPIMCFEPMWNINDFTCRLHGGMITLISEIQAWVMALGSFDRLITVTKPHRFLYKNKFSFQLTIIIICVLILVVLIC